MKPKELKSEKEYEVALSRIDELIDITADDPREDELEFLSILVERYEDKHYPMGLSEPIEAIKFRMEQQELNEEDLIPYIGNLKLVQDILNRKENLNSKMIKLLNQELGIPLEVLEQ